MIHLYHGDGKGKTTAAFGLALRALGRGRTVGIVQFLKSENSGERFALASLPGATLVALPEQVTFTFRMTEEERGQAAQRCQDYCAQALALARSGKAQLLVLDEVCAAITSGLLPLETVLSLLERLPEETEVVLTGRNPPEELRVRADYETEFVKRKHPYDQGVSAREGIEY
jgi:cob(I)alamin adenosyltransferase